MCLDRVTNEQWDDGIYYKVFVEVDNKTYRGLFFDCYESKVLGQEYCANVEMCDKGYYTGFHVFKLKEDAKAYLRCYLYPIILAGLRVKRVKVTGFLASGYQYNMKCGVFQYMTIL